MQSIETTSASDCGQGSANGGATAAVVGIAAVGLIAALASHHRKTNNRNANAEHDGEYQRGYNDAIYGGTYDRNDSEGYHNGFMAGEAERDNRRAANSRFVRGASSAAQSACTQRGDEYLNVPSGSSVPVSVDSIGRDGYEIIVASGHYRARCTVDSRGRVSDMNPY